MHPTVTLPHPSSCMTAMFCGSAWQNKVRTKKKNIFITAFPWMWCLQNVLHIWLLYAAEASNWKTMLCSLRSSHVPSPLPHCTVYCCWFSLCLFIPLMLYLSPSLPLHAIPYVGERAKILLFFKRVFGSQQLAKLWHRFAILLILKTTQNAIENCV